MNIRVTTTINVKGILIRRGLGDSDEARKFLAARVKIRSDPYTPFQSGMLKNTAQVTGGGRTLVYPQPYAHYLYHGMVMGPNVLTKNGWISLAPKGGKQYTGKSIKYHGGPTRGPRWVARMMEKDGRNIVKDMEAYIAGRGARY